MMRAQWLWIGVLAAILLLTGTEARTQSKDSIQERDTLAVYKKIKKTAYRYKFTRLLFHAIFVDPAPETYHQKPLSDQQQEKDPFRKYSGEIIRAVIIEVFDPFGYSVNDTSEKVTNPFQRLGNRYHVTTRHRIIRNMLLFRENDTLDIVKLSESERLLRTAGYIRDARIYVRKASLYDDGVEVKVVVQDKWALDAILSYHGNGGSLQLRDKNILGSGHRFEQLFKLNIEGDYELKGRYFVQNISRTFVSASLSYQRTNIHTHVGAAFDRPFYSALSRWAYSLSGSMNWTDYFYTDPLEQQQKIFPLRYYTTDAWVARSLSPHKSAERRFSNIVVSLRYASRIFTSRPTFDIDSVYANLNSELYLSGISFSLRKYYKDQYIFRFGTNEDIPEGALIQVLYGLLYKEKSGFGHYSGVEVSRGKHFENIGYLSGWAAFGTHIIPRDSSISTLNLGITYFTDLLRGRRWYFRQFLYMRYVTGFNRPQSEKVSFLPEEMYGIGNGQLSGRQKLVMNLEGVTYAPYNILGFRFAPLLLMGFGTLAEEGRPLFSGRLYQAYAVGLLLRNESLLNSSFKITFGFYPFQPDPSAKWFRYNPVTSFSVRFRSYAVQKPELVSYR